MIHVQASTLVLKLFARGLRHSNLRTHATLHVWKLLAWVDAEEMAGEKEMTCCVRGHHVYKNIRAAAIGDVLVCSCWCVVVRKANYGRSHEGFRKPYLYGFFVLPV